MVSKTLASKLASGEHSIPVAYFSSYIPRECGIATFTKDLTNAINILNPHRLAEIIAVDEPESPTREYPWEVKFRIDQEDTDHYLAAADYINKSDINVVSIQHEFGIYGGSEGEHLIAFMKSVKKPIVTTLHTVLDDPGDHRWRLMREIAKYSEALVVMIETAAQRLQDIYKIEKEKIIVIPHGVPDIPYGPPDYHKKELNLSDHITLSTFGLINPGKGIEYVIDALPDVVKNYPQLKYLILGAMHPTFVKKYGDDYRKSLINKVNDRKLQNHVHFENRYLPLEDIIKYLRATDVYITPYLGIQQISSGTLAYAIGAGKACISTPYLYANEVLSEDRGLLVPFRDSRAMAEAILHILNNAEKRKEIEKRAYIHGRSMVWTNVAHKYLELFALVSRSGKLRSRYGNL